MADAVHVATTAVAAAIFTVIDVAAQLTCRIEELGFRVGVGLG